MTVTFGGMLAEIAMAAMLVEIAGEGCTVVN